MPEIRPPSFSTNLIVASAIPAKLVWLGPHRPPAGLIPMKSDPLNGEAPKGRTATPAAGVIETLRHLRARSPQESLGVQTQHGLLKASLLAAVITGAALVALTAGPYFMHKAAPAGAAPAAAPNSGGGDSPAPAPAPSTSPNTEAKKPAGEPGKTPKGKDLPDVLGESGVKTGTPKSNPLDKKDDDIFKELGPK
jgi:hypothetical protein